MAPIMVGRIAMQYRRVDCTPPAGLEVVVDGKLDQCLILEKWDLYDYSALCRECG